MYEVHDTMHIFPSENFEHENSPFVRHVGTKPKNNLTGKIIRAERVDGRWNSIENDGGSIGGQTRLTLSSSSHGGTESSSGSGNTHGVKPIFEIGSGSGRSWKNMFTKRRNLKTNAKATANAVNIRA